MRLKNLIITTVCMISMAVPLPSTALGRNEFIINIEEMNVRTDDAATKDEIDKVIKDIQVEFNKKIKTDDDYKKIKEYINIAKKVVPNSNILMAAGTYYDQNKMKLRQGNYIETILDLEEGMTETEIFRVGITHANSARNAALQEFPNDVNKADAFRHYTWNFISTKDSSIGKYKTRTATINHEWGILLINMILSYYDEKYNEYIINGYDDYNAANKAFMDATLWIPYAKYQLVIICKSNYSFFKGFFKVSNIMDLINNVWGRSGPERHSDYRKGFYADYSNLVLNENWVGDYQYNLVWQNEWYTY